jgi:hypothetical protein
MDGPRRLSVLEWVWLALSVAGWVMLIWLLIEA